MLEPKKDKRQCGTCKHFAKGCADKECHFPELESWEPRIRVTLDGAEELVDELKGVIEETLASKEKKYRVCLVRHPSDGTGRNYAFLSDFCLEEGQNVLVDTKYGKAWGVVSEGTREMEEDDYRFLLKIINRDKMKKVLGVFVPFHKCIGEEKVNE